MKLMLLLGLLFSFNSFCLANVMLDKNDMDQILTAVKEQGGMSEEEFNEAQQHLIIMSDEEFKKKFNEMSDEQLELFKSKVLKHIKNNPKLLEKINQLKSRALQELNKMSDEEFKKKFNKMSDEELEWFKYKNSEHLKNNPKLLEKINQLKKQ